jgi:pyruvate,water dikinase
VAYRAGQHAEEPSLAVVVQRMVGADAAGVLFTADPVHRRRLDGHDQRRLGPWGGAGQRRDHPDTFTVDRATGRIADRSVVLGPRHGHPTLDEAQAERLAALGVQIQALDSRPVDVEWCRAGDDLWVVPGPADHRPRRARPLNDSRTGDFVCGPTPTSARRSPT